MHTGPWRGHNLLSSGTCTSAGSLLQSGLDCTLQRHQAAVIQQLTQKQASWRKMTSLSLKVIHSKLLPIQNQWPSLAFRSYEVIWQLEVFHQISGSEFPGSWAFKGCSFAQISKFRQIASFAFNCYLLACSYFSTPFSFSAAHLSAISMG